jgi:hypothetical protein
MSRWIAIGLKQSVVSGLWNTTEPVYICGNWGYNGPVALGLDPPVGVTRITVS